MITLQEPYRENENTVDAASMLHAVPMNEPLNTMRSMFTASEYLVQLHLGDDFIDLPAAYTALTAHLRKYSEMQGGRGCSSGAGLHAGAPVTMPAIGNSTTPDRLGTCPRAPDVGNTSNLRS